LISAGRQESHRSTEEVARALAQECQQRGVSVEAKRAKDLENGR
jgi:hypothetical protein